MKIGRIIRRVAGRLEIVGLELCTHSYQKMAGVLFSLEGVEKVYTSLHKCCETCAVECLLKKQVMSVAAMVLEVYTDVLTDQVHHELISDEDSQKLYLEVLLKVWDENNLHAMPYEHVKGSAKSVLIFDSIYKIAGGTFEAQPLFLGWSPESRFYKPSNS